MTLTLGVGGLKLRAPHLHAIGLDLTSSCRKLIRTRNPGQRMADGPTDIVRVKVVTLTLGVSGKCCA